MPVRSNAFQKLITQINKQLAENAHVVESAMLANAITGKPREVDILIETSIAGYETRISVECIDWKRKADAPWVEKIYQKHQALPTDKLIIVSRLGFSAEALKIARFHNIVALTLETSTETDWLQLIRSIRVSGARLYIESSEIQICDLLEGATVERPIVFYDPVGNPGDLLGLIRADVVSSVDLNKALCDLVDEDKEITKLTLALDVTIGKFRDWYLLDSRGRKHYVKWFRMNGTVERSEKIREVQYAKYAGANVAFAPLCEEDESIVVFVQSADGTISITADSLAKLQKTEGTLIAAYHFYKGQLLLKIVQDQE